MGALIVALVTSTIGKYVIAGISAAILGLGAYLRVKAIGAKAERDKEAAAETAAVNSAKAVQGQVDQLNPDAAKKELGTWSKS